MHCVLGGLLTRFSRIVQWYRSVYAPCTWPWTKMVRKEEKTHCGKELNYEMIELRSRLILSTWCNLPEKLSRIMKLTFIRVQLADLWSIVQAMGCSYVILSEKEMIKKLEKKKRPSRRALWWAIWQSVDKCFEFEFHATFPKSCGFFLGRNTKYELLSNWRPTRHQTYHHISECFRFPSRFGFSEIKMAIS